MDWLDWLLVICIFVVMFGVGCFRGRIDHE
jgi:hypothetical protein